MKQIYLLLALLIAAISSYSQEPPPETPKNKEIAESIEVLKVAYITKELDLTADEAQQFWPTYNSFFSEVKKARQDHKDDDIAFEEKRVGLMKKYRENFRKILNNEDRVKRCFRAEPKFHNMLRREWQNRKDKMPPPRRHPGPMGPKRG